jgi:rare lipoprotein A
MTTTLHAQDTEEWGLASYYSDSFDGKQTAYGVTYDKAAFTAAHKIHPYGTMLKITRLDNQKSVQVKVIDKGPYIKGRVVDVSRAAAARLDLIQDGVAEVKVEVVGRSSSSPATAQAKKPERKTPDSYDGPAPRRIADVPEEQPAPEKKATKSTTSSSKAASSASSTKKASSKKTTSAAAPAKARLVGKEFQQYGVYKISIQKPDQGNYGVQVASLTNYQNVFRQVTDLQERSFDDILVSIEEGKGAPVYKIILGPFDSEAAADNYRKNLASRYKIKGFVTELSPEENARP